ncbi:MAG: Dps family protein [Gemmatimonadaceae bacterium]
MTTTTRPAPQTHAKPATRDDHHMTQAYGQLRKLPLALSEAACRKSVENLNQLLADTMTLRDLYKKHHWQVSGPNFYALHLLFDKHAGEQTELIDSIAERVMMLGGVSIAMAQDVAETSIIPRPPRGRETAEAQIDRLLRAHEALLEEARSMARDAAKSGDDGTNDMIIGDVIRGNEMQMWFLAEHVANAHR